MKYIILDLKIFKVPRYRMTPRVLRYHQTSYLVPKKKNAIRRHHRTTITQQRFMLQGQFTKEHLHITVADPEYHR